MSNIYIQEPPTEGKILLVTTAGDIDVELWSKEAPKACRNFVQLCLEGYYEKTIFHRVIPGFIVQGGDPTGTGTGGESIYGKPFRDEFHTRLRFTRRGLVAMANAGPNDNGSQFFLTLGACPELQNKHTVFGKVAGNTIYNLPRFEEGDIGKHDRPEYPHKIISTEVLNNPFPDIVPRETVNIENEVSRESRKKKKGTKNFKLLSFGDEAEEDEEEAVVATKKMPNKSNSAHDIAMDPTLSSSIDESREREDELKRIQEKLKKEERKIKLITESQENPPIKESDPNEEMNKGKRRSEIRAEIRKLKRELQDKGSEEKKSSDDEQHVAKKPKQNSVFEQYCKDKAKYEDEKKKLPIKGVLRESHTLALLERFSNKIKEASDRSNSDSTAKQDDGDADNDDGDDNNNDNDDDDDDLDDEKDDNDESWLIHRLQFDENEPVFAKDASAKDDHWYDITDPRNALNKRRREGKSRSSKAK